MAQTNFEEMVKNFQKFAMEVFFGNDQESKSKLIEELKNILKLGTHLQAPKRKIVNMDQSMAKKIKLDPNRKVDLPNEIWLKIINFLSPKDVHGKNYFFISNVFIIPRCGNFNFVS